MLWQADAEVQAEVVSNLAAAVSGAAVNSYDDQYNKSRKKHIIPDTSPAHYIIPIDQINLGMFSTTSGTHSSPGGRLLKDEKPNTLKNSSVVS